MTVAELLASVTRRGVELRVEASRLRVRDPEGALSVTDREALTARRTEIVAAVRERSAADIRSYPLSHNQRSLWFVAQEAPESSAYNIAIAIRILSPVDPAAVRESLQGMVDRHAMLRTTYHLDGDGQPIQRTVGFREVCFERFSVPDISVEDLRIRAEAGYRRPFDLERGPIFRAAFYTRAANDHLLVVVVHHIAADLWSLGLLSDDFLSLYAEAAGFVPKTVSSSLTDYAGFAEWQSRLLTGPQGDRLADAWQTRLHALPPPLALPADRPRPERKTFRGKTLSVTAGPDLLPGLREVARGHSATLFVVLLAAFDAMLFRLTGADDVIVGIPTSGRTESRFDQVVGYFVNPVPIRTTVTARMAFRSLLVQVRETVREALDSQDYPLALMVQRAQITRDASRSPLFETFFSVLRSDKVKTGAAARVENQDESAAFRYEPFALNQLEGQFDLALQLIEHEAQLDLAFRYSTDLFDESTIREFAVHYLTLLSGVVLNPDAPLELLCESVESASEDGVIESLLASLAARDIRVTLDGDRLRLNAPAGAVNDELKRALATHKPEIIAALRAVQPERNAFRRRSRTSPLAISFAQQRLWVFDRTQPGTAHYNIALPLRISGVLDQSAMTMALDALVERHESLRTCIRDDQGRPDAHIEEYSGTTVRHVDLSGLSDAERELEAHRLCMMRALEPFDLARGPLAGFLLVRLAPDEHRLLVCMHHIAADGWSLAVAAREIAAVYDAAIVGRPSPLQPLPIQYADYAAWQHEQLTSGLLARQLIYWQQELASAPASLELPTDQLRPAVQSFRGRRRSLRLPSELLDALKAFSRAHEVTLYMTLLSAWLVLLARYSGQEDIVVGLPVANRDQPELESLIGCFVNNLVMRGRLEGDPRFVDFLRQVKSTVLRAFDHRELPFDRLVEALRPARDPSHHPIFQTLFTLHSFPMQATQPTGLHVEVVDTGDGPASARFDLTLEIDELEDGLRLVYEYVVDLFEAETIERLHGHYLTLLRHVLADPQQTVRNIPLLTAGDERLLVDDVNATGLAHDRSAIVPHLIEAVALRTPDAVAVEADDATLTYAELDRRGNQLAHVLQGLGVVPGSLVGVCLDRNSLLPVALLGVLKAGAAYVPVDPTHPPDRLAYTLRDAGVSCLVTETRFADAVAGLEASLICLDTEPSLFIAASSEAPGVAIAARDLAYVIYTSGSTGRPKGVEVEHGNLVNLLLAMQQEPGISAGDVLLAVTTPSFDIAGLEIFLPLVSGGRLVIASRDDVLDGERLRARIESSGATIMQATPATWRTLLDTGWAGKGDLTALCGGEALPRDLARALLTRVRALWNMYGPTETTIWSTLHRVTDSDRDVPIGHPIANTAVFVLDAAGRPVPRGVAGELCIGGEGVARGYRRQPELTAEKFVTLAVGGRPAVRVYKTGDVVRLTSDGPLEFIGRRDHQVKLRGYRIELGEIESVLVQDSAVRRCIVVVREDSPGNRRLVAYVVPAEGATIAEDELRTVLRARLPEYMVPSAIVVLGVLPLTPNGKIDRKALPVPRAWRAATGSAGEAIMSAAQRTVAAIWCDVLRLDRVGLHENFFDIGGHSLLVIQVHAALRREFGLELTVVDLFQRTTVAAQAELLSPSADQNVGLQRAHARLARQGLTTATVVESGQ